MRRIIVTLHPAQPSDVDGVVKRLIDAGMIVGRVSPLMGVVSGRASAETVLKLRAEPGVACIADETCLWDQAAFK